MGHGEESPMPNAQCPMPNAQCPMPNAQCPMPNAQCPKSAGGYPSPCHLRDGVSRRLSMK
ncbi:hypothetical protein HUN01_34305 [Nostoc edaphicum CCNP1411]|uniref:Uncharacterized protein n=1 Tax=Nostoc edaphicum CCNP1411 TaxID=1472755 RepID=A0A7D7LG42_9NOSO|nr:hypothetical protein [Nostoc edaphicum]QMS92418.1 hypothetical protein HUN01_34305 [Nostoc edaphicum CCNP1411]